jgi:hypothetical protein
LTKALEAAELLLAKWRRDPHRQLTVVQSLWVRGFPQMIAGVYVAMTLLTWLNRNLPHWLDWGF